MEKTDYLLVLNSIRVGVKNAPEHQSVEVSGVGKVDSDISDIGNVIGIAVGKHIVELGLDKEDFINGIKHGISLKDGTH
jgi:hypothetical protein